MIFKLKTSKKTQEIFEEIGKSTALKPYTLVKHAIAWSLKEQGKTLLLSSHNIFEISKLCDAIYFLDSGILKSASLDYLQLKEEYYELYATKGRA